MKNLLFVALILTFGCSKSELADITTPQSAACSSVTKAVVKRQMLNVAGTDFFYYLEGAWSINNSNRVYPSFLSPSLQVEGQKVEIHYNATNEQYTYIPCTEAHPTGLVEEHMPRVELCSVVSTL